MAEVKTALLEQEPGIYVLTSDHTIADVLRHLINVEGSDAEEIKAILEMGL